MLAAVPVAAAAPLLAIADGIEKERAEAPEPAPVTAKGVRYAALPWGKVRGLGQNGGYVAAYDRGGRELWVLKVYDVTYDKTREEDKQDVFITRLALDAEARHLVVENERGAIYSVDLRTRAVRALSPRR